MEPLVHSYVAGVNADLEKKARDLEKKNNKLLKEVGRLNNKVTKLEDDLDSVEQYNRRNTLRIGGVPEEPSENTDAKVVKIASAADCTIQLNEIDRSHRVGKAKKDRPKDIIVKFVSYNARVRLYEARMRLKETDGYNSVTINEHLTRKRKQLLVRARKMVKGKLLKKAWSRDGTVYIEDLKDRRRKINNESDLDRYKTKKATSKKSKLDAEDNST